MSIKQPIANDYEQENQNENSQVLLAFANDDNNIHFAIPVFHTPQIGYQTYDTTKHRDEDGKIMRRKPIGNPVGE
jgi:hypothetical protein